LIVTIPIWHIGAVGGRFPVSLSDPAVYPAGRMILHKPLAVEGVMQGQGFGKGGIPVKPFSSISDWRQNGGLILFFIRKVLKKSGWAWEGGREAGTQPSPSARGQLFRSDFRRFGKISAEATRENTFSEACLCRPHRANAFIW
jgi:hypothetical protein